IREFISPRLGIRFDLSGPEMVVYGPDGDRFLTFEEMKTAHVQAQQAADRAQQAAGRAQQMADQANQRSVRLAELSRKARRGQASADEQQELERLEEQAALGFPE